METFDYVIVGAGSAGCVLADRLSASGNATVAIIEAGGHDWRFWIKTPIGYGKTFHDPKVNWRYTTEPDPGIAGRAAYWPRGKVMGGSSSINAMVYSRGLPDDYDDWRAAGNPGWGWSDVQPIFKSFERRIAPDGTSKGEGPLFVSDREPECHPIKRFFYRAAKEIGLPKAKDVNGPEPEGVGAYQITTRYGLRCSSADAFLRPALWRQNVKLILHAEVQRVTIEGRRATGVTMRMSDGSVRTVRARRDVILSAGAVNTPKLMQLSGVGPGATLAAHGVEVLHDMSGVGAAMQDHLGISYFYRATEPTLNEVFGAWFGRIAAGIRFLTMRSGPLSLSVNQMGGLVRSSSKAARPDMQLYFNPVSYTTEYKNKRPLMKPDPFPGFIMGFNSCRPTSTGKIEIRSADPDAAPKITPNYLSTNQDLADVVAGARLIGRLERAPSMRALIDSANLDLNASSDDEVVDDFKARCGTIYHPCGTCRMAPEADGGVVDPECRVYGLEGLRVVDASVFPNITSANTNAPTIMVAHKAASAILAAE